MSQRNHKPGRSERRKAVLRTAWVLAGIVVLIYGYMVLRGVLNYYS